MPATMAEIPAGAAVRLERAPDHAGALDRDTWYRRTGTIAGAALVRPIVGSPLPGRYREGDLYIVDESAVVVAACDPGEPA